ncbi:MAG: hypothetical protein ACXVCY_04350 [Pseudobdellovibrionaceae bacterium]
MQVRYVKKTKVRQEDNLFELKDGTIVELSQAMKALKTYQACFGYHHTLESVREHGDWNGDVFNQLLEGKNPLTGKQVNIVRPTAKSITGESVIFILDEKPDSFGEILLPSGISFTSNVLVHKDGPKALSHYFGNAEIVCEKTLIKARFEIPFARIPDFDLYAIPCGKVLEYEDNVSSKIVKKAIFDSISISTSRNSDDRIGPIKWEL